MIATPAKRNTTWSDPCPQHGNVYKFQVDGALHDLHVPSRDVLPAQVEEEGGGGPGCAIFFGKYTIPPTNIDPAMGGWKMSFHQDLVIVTVYIN